MFDLLKRLAEKFFKKLLDYIWHANIKYYGKTKAAERLDITAKSEKGIFFPFQSPCISWPCQNAATCAAHYEKNSYVCVCVKGYTGQHCETGSALAT